MPELQEDEHRTAAEPPLVWDLQRAVDLGLTEMRGETLKPLTGVRQQTTSTSVSV